MAGEEAFESLHSKTSRIGGRGVALKEGQRDRRVDVEEDPRRARPEGVQLRAQLVAQAHPGGDQVLAGAGQRPKCLGLVAVGAKRAQPVGVGARQLGQDEGVEAVGLAAGRLIARPGRLQRVGVDRQDGEAGIQQPVDQQAVGALDRNPLDAQGPHPGDQRPDPSLVVGEELARKLPARCVDHAKRVLLAGPVDPRRRLIHRVPPSFALPCAGREVPLRLLIVRRSGAPLPVAASGASGRREALVSRGPSARQARRALSRRRSASLFIPPGSSTASLRSASQSQKNKGEVLL